MRLASLSIFAFAGIAMLSLHMSGLHMHANAQGEASGLHGTHVHDVASDGHDHSADVDISVSDLGIAGSKLMPVLLLALMVGLAVVWTHLAVRPPPEITPCRRILSRWRPPLRAPPISL